MIFSDCLNRTEEALQNAFPGKDQVSHAVTYALLSGGKRVRPLIVHSIAEALGNGYDVMDAALSIEFFHTASLIADDLPCMDNDSVRRGKGAVHTVFGETIALLSSYALIAEAFKKIEENGRKMALVASNAFEAVAICLEQASRSAGIKGAVLGQYYDLVGSELSVEEVLYLKTGTLFEGAFVLGWVFGGGEFLYLDEVRKLAKHLGLAFQIQDDLNDMGQDGEREGLNYAQVVGEDLAEKRFRHELGAAFQLLQDLPLEKGLLIPLLQQVFPAF